MRNKILTKIEAIVGTTNLTTTRASLDFERILEIY